MSILTAVQPPTIVPLSLCAADVDAIEATDAEIHSDTDESVDIGPIVALGGAYLRVRSADLTDVAGALRQLADRILDTVYEARQDRLDLERHRCHCGALLELEEETCGSRQCFVWAHS